MSTGKSTNLARDQDRPDARRDWRVLLPVLVIAAGLAAYYNSFAGVFLFDDRLHILGARRLRALWPLWEALARRRPVVDYSLAINHAIGGGDAWSYHAVNLAAHILAALTLYGIVRRTLLRGVGAAGFSPREPSDTGEIAQAKACGSEKASRWIALAVALIWVVHPLQTQSVTYVIQRAESLMGLFYLLTLYCVIRGVESSHRVWWYASAVVACALGMGSKAVMVTAPLVVLLYDRVFISKSFTDTFRRRWGLYVGLATTWGVLWACGNVKGVLNPSAKGMHIGFGFKDITPLEYALTQFGVLVRYLELSLWPHPLSLDYYWPVARTAGAIVPPTIVIAALLITTLWAFRKRSSLGFVGAWFFITLAPTSSFIPIRDPLFEHRMYLSLAAVIVLAVIGADAGLRYFAARRSPGNPIRRCVAAALVVVAVGSLGYGTVRRNQDYHSEVSMWRDALAKHPGNPRAAENLGIALLGAGQMEEAMKALRDAVRISPRSANVHNALGFALVAHNRLDEAIASFHEALRLRPTFVRAHKNLGNALLDKGEIDEAIEAFGDALEINPRDPDARLDLGTALFTLGKIDEAIEQFRQALQIDPRHAKALGNLGNALLSKGQIDEAIEAFQEALQVNERSHNAYNGLGIALASLGKLDEAVESFRQALWLKPDFANAHCNLAKCLFGKGDEEGAIRHYSSALKIRPDDPNIHYELGMTLDKQGNTSDAIEEYQETLRIKPDHTGARKALEAALAELGSSPTNR